MNWLRYSGISVTITLNPFHWSLLPWHNRFYDEWVGPNEQHYNVGWLFLTIRLWIDDGSW